jgi:8-oxo-dGTP diphosphatase
MPDIVHVAVAVIINQKHEVCISLRHKDAHQGGLWEFPGGKIEARETAIQALIREIEEELNLRILSSRPLITIPHQYQDKTVCLHVFKVLSYEGQTVGLEGQEVRWVAQSQLPSYDFPEANQAIIKALQLPDKYLITGKFDDEKDFLEKLQHALDDGIRLVQLRLKAGDLKPARVTILAEQVSSLCLSSDARLLLNISECYLSALDLSAIKFDGFHADSKTLKELCQRPDSILFSASCHNEQELQKAMQLKADFVVLSPVQKTASHPEMDALGWQLFSDLTASCSVPVYALGGVSGEDLEKAWLKGAQGIAGISAFWK